VPFSRWAGERASERVSIDTNWATVYNTGSTMTKVILYGKPGCHLCDDVRTVLLSVQPKYRFELHEVDIMGDEDLFNRYCIDIPVVTIDGEDFCQYKIDVNKLEKKLETLAKGIHQ